MRKVGRIFVATAAAGFGYFIYLYLTLPDVRELRASNPSTTAFIDLRAREARAQGQEPRRLQRWVSYERISPQLKRAVLVAEDAAFYDHEGIDVEQIKESIEADLVKGRLARGGSTITQQLAKNLYLSPSRNPLRKVRELFIARRLEAELSKRRILELYLNEIEWGEGIYGAEAASRAYFGSPAAALGPDEAALLAAAIVNPRELSPAHPSARLRRRQRLIRDRMGYVTPPPPITNVVEPVPAPGAPIIIPGEPVMTETPAEPAAQTPAEPATQAPPESAPAPPAELPAAPTGP